MSHSLLHNAVAQRLTEYGLFSSRTIHHIATFAKTQAAYKTYQDFFASVGMPEPTMHRTAKGQGVPLVDISARQPEKGVIVYHLPMANPLDENQRYQLATLAGVLPEYRIIAFGNPSGPPYSFVEQNVTPWQWLTIAFGRDRRRLVAAELEYLASQNITKTHQVGYSFGAMKALIESQYAPRDSVQSIVTVEPVAHPRYKKQLLGDFERTLRPLGDYVNRTGLGTYFAARKVAENVDYHKGLRRPINIAIGLLLSRLDFMTLLRQALQKQPSARATIAWATKSELGNDAHLSTALDALRQSGASVKPMRLKGDTHAVANDIHVMAAIVYEAIQAQ